MRLVSFGAAAMSLTLVSCASDTPARLSQNGSDGARQCFRLEQARSITYTPEGGLRIEAGLGRFYQADIVGSCPDIDRVNHYVLFAEAGRNREICTGDLALVQPKELNQTTAPYACRIKVNGQTE